MGVVIEICKNTPGVETRSKPLKSVDGRKAYRFQLKWVNTADETAIAVFMNGEERAVFFTVFI